MLSSAGAGLPSRPAIAVACLRARPPRPPRARRPRHPRSPREAQRPLRGAAPRAGSVLSRPGLGSGRLRDGPHRSRHGLLRGHGPQRVRGRRRPPARPLRELEGALRVARRAADPGDRGDQWTRARRRLGAGGVVRHPPGVAGRAPRPSRGGARHPGVVRGAARNVPRAGGAGARLHGSHPHRGGGARARGRARGRRGSGRPRRRARPRDGQARPGRPRIIIETARGGAAARAWEAELRLFRQALFAGR